MAYDSEARAQGDIRGFLNRFQRKQYLSEVAKSTRDQLGVSIKKYRAEKHIVDCWNFLEIDFETMLGCDSVFEPDLNECKIYNRWNQPYGSGIAGYARFNSVDYMGLRIPDQGLAKQATYDWLYYSPIDKPCIFFDGNDDYIDPGAETLIWSKAITKFSLSVWINPSEMYDRDYRLITCINDGNDSISLGFTHGDSPLTMSTNVTKDAFATAGICSTLLLEPYKFNRWYQVTVTYDSTLGSNNLKLYVNGVLQSQATYAFTITIAATAKMMIGRNELDPVGSFQYFGYMRQWRWWDGVALTSTEVSNLWKGKDGLVTTPSYYLAMDENTGDPFDKITNSDKGILTGGAKWITDPVTPPLPDWTSNTPKLTNSIFLDGVDDYLDCGVDTALWSKSLTKFTISFWFNPTKTNVDESFCNVATLADGNDEIFIGYTGGNLVFDVTNDAYGTEGLVTAAGFTTKHRWYHIVMTYDKDLASNNVKAYVNGALAGQANYINKTLAIAATSSLLFGHYQFDPADQFHGGGFYRDMQWWGSVALSAAEALDLFEGDYTGVAPDYKLDTNRGYGNPKDTISGTKTATLTLGARWGNNTSSIKMGEVLAMNIGPNQSTFGNIQNQFLGVQDLDIPIYFDGVDDLIEIASSAPLQLLQFSIFCRFKSGKDYSDAAFMVNKGGVGSDAVGENDNYSLKINASGQAVSGGFEDNAGAGADHYATSPYGYEDDRWHSACVTYDQVTVRLYIDGVQVDTHATVTTPETNTKPLRLGANSRALEKFLQGFLRAVVIWNNDLTANEVSQMHNTGIIPQSGAIVYSNALDNFSTTDFDWTTNNYTDSFWICPTDLTDYGDDRVIHLHTIDANNYKSYMIDNADNKLFVEFVIGGVATRAESFRALVPNRWYHVFIAFDSLNKVITLMVDGEQGVSSAKSGHTAVTNYPRPSYCGFAGMAWTEGFNGYFANQISYKHQPSVLIDGTNDYVDCLNDAALWSKALSKFSITFWWYQVAVAVTADRYIISHGNANNLGFRVINTITTDNLQFIIKDGVGTNFTAQSSTHSKGAGRWRHIAVVYDNSLGSANVKIYVDGIVGTTTANFTTAINLSAILTLGSDINANTPNACYRDFKFWDATALTAQQVRLDSMYMLQTPLPSYWLEINEGTGSPRDIISCTKFATLVNGPTYSATRGKNLTVFEAIHLYRNHTKYHVDPTRDPCFSGVSASG